MGFSLTHELLARPKAVQGLSAKFACEQVYWEAQRNDEYKGGEYPGAKPKAEGTSVLAGVKAIQKLGYITEYRWAFGIKDLALAVGHVGPAVLGLNWYEGMFEPHSCGFLHVEGGLAGGHAILCKGVDIKHKTFLLHNSWGKKWGAGGDCIVSWDEMDLLLQEDGEAVVPLGRRLRGVE